MGGGEVGEEWGRVGGVYCLVGRFFWRSGRVFEIARIGGGEDVIRFRGLFYFVEKWF